MRIVYFGTPEMSAQLLRKLRQQGLDIVGIVTQPDRMRARKGSLQPSPVSQAAGDLPQLKPNSCRDPEVIAWVKALEPDFLIVFAFGQILPQELLDVPKEGALNLHPSALPKYRGAAPLQRAIMAGESETAVSIMEMVLKMDAGPVYWSEPTAITDETTFGELADRAVEIGARGFGEVLAQFREMTPSTQQDSKVTFAPKIEKKECRIDWSLSPRQIVRHIHALSPAPGAYCEVESPGKKYRLKIFRACVSHRESPGNLCFMGVDLLAVQPEGSRLMSAEEFIRGSNNFKFLV
jgi:methionyl-tRNA formyltransferase